MGTLLDYATVSMGKKDTMVKDRGLKQHLWVLTRVPWKLGYSALPISFIHYALVTVIYWVELTPAIKLSASSGSPSNLVTKAACFGKPAVSLVNRKSIVTNDSQQNLAMMIQVLTFRAANWIQSNKKNLKIAILIETIKTTQRDIWWVNCTTVLQTSMYCGNLLPSTNEAFCVFPRALLNPAKLKVAHTKSSRTFHSLIYRCKIISDHFKGVFLFCKGTLNFRETSYTTVCTVECATCIIYSY